MKKLSRSEMKKVMGGYVTTQCYARCTQEGGDPVVIPIGDSCALAANTCNLGGYWGETNCWCNSVGHP